MEYPGGGIFSGSRDEGWDLADGFPFLGKSFFEEGGPDAVGDPGSKEFKVTNLVDATSAVEYGELRKKTCFAYFC